MADKHEGKGQRAEGRFNHVILRPDGTVGIAGSILIENRQRFLNYIRTRETWVTQDDVKRDFPASTFQQTFA